MKLEIMNVKKIEKKYFKLKMQVIFKQLPDSTENNYILTTLEVSCVIKRKILGLWFSHMANSIVLDGEFTGPRSPRAKNGSLSSPAQT